jgi:hypothetical protein
VTKAAPDNFKLKAIIREVILSKSFSGTPNSTTTSAGTQQNKKMIQQKSKFLAVSEQ